MQIGNPQIMRLSCVLKLLKYIAVSENPLSLHSKDEGEVQAKGVGSKGKKE